MYSNAVQLITSIFLLKTKQLKVLQASLLGSILTNLLLMTGLGFLLGGINRLEQYFNAAVGQTISMLLLLAVSSLVIPTASQLITKASPNDILSQSRGTSVIILISYGLWLFFQLKTNTSMFDEPPRPAPKARSRGIAKGETSKSLAHIGMPAMAISVGGVDFEDAVRTGQEDENKEPQLAFVTGILVVLLSTVLIAFNTQFATDSIQNLLTVAGLSSNFIGIVVLPSLSCDPTSVVVAIRDKMDLSITLTLERCMQTSLMVVPLTVLLAWCMGIQLSLDFDGFLIAGLFTSIIIVTYVVQEGRSNW